MSQKQVDTKPLHSLAAKIKSAVGIIVPVVACIGVGMYISNVSSGQIAISASIDGTTCGYVSSYSDMHSAAAQLESTILNATAGEYAPDFDITFELVHTDSPEYLTKDDCYALLFERIENDFNEGYMLYVDDKQIAAYENGEELDALIDNIEFELMAKKPVFFSDVKLQNKVRIEKQLCLTSMFKSIEEINTLINPISDEITNAAVPGDITSSDVIAKIGAVEAAAPDVISTSETDYSISRSAETTDNNTVLKYNYINTATLSEYIPFEIEYVDDPNLFIGTEKLVKEGKNGERNVTYEILYNENGTIVERIPVAESLTKQPVNRIVGVGTKPIPAAVPTGKFIWPCETTLGISSGYGWRTIYGYTEFHLGIDIPNITGSPVWASDGGVVVFADNTPSYGNNIRIAHVNGYSTVYAHLDEILVKVGDKVYPGQQIGKIGNTGLSYGSHLHFEVRINEQTIDPMDVLPK